MDTLRVVHSEHENALRHTPIRPTDRNAYRAVKVVVKAPDSDIKDSDVLATLAPRTDENSLRTILASEWIHESPYVLDWGGLP